MQSEKFLNSLRILSDGQGMIRTAKQQIKRTPRISLREQQKMYTKQAMYENYKNKGQSFVRDDSWRSLNTTREDFQVYSNAFISTK